MSPSSVPGRHDASSEPWRVRIRDKDGEVRGAGFLVATGQVLTCAHVVGRDMSGLVPADTVSVEFVSLRATPVVTARVALGGWIPMGEDETGDIAVLDLDGPAPAQARPAALRRLATVGRSVHAFGFPARAEEYGVNVAAVVSWQGGPGGELIQLDSPSPDNGITKGFSGAAVVDDQIGEVIGMVVAEYSRDKPTVSWMCPVETILGYLRDLPGLVDSVAGKAAVDKELTTDVGDISDPTPSREFGLWFRWAGPPVRLVVTGEVSSPRSSGLRRMILLADRESRPEVGTEVGHLVPPVGGIDLAVEATGTTVAELRTRIRERYEPGGAGPRSPRSIVVDGVDDAAAPEELLRDVLKPLADEGVRLLLGFRRTSSPAWALAMRLWPGQDKPDDHPDVLGARVTELTRRINELATREDRLGGYRAHVADRVVIAQRDGKVRQRACELAWRVGPLGGGVSDPDPAVVTRTALAVERAERAVDRACRKVDEAWHALDVSLEELRGLRARLEAYHAMAIDRGRAEDRGLDGAYRRAHAELHRRPADLAVAARLVDAYRAAIEDARS